MERRVFEKTSLFMRIHKRKIKCVLIERKAKLKKIEEKCYRNECKVVRLMGIFRKRKKVEKKYCAVNGGYLIFTC